MTVTFYILKIVIAIIVDDIYVFFISGSFQFPIGTVSLYAHDLGRIHQCYFQLYFREVT